MGCIENSKCTESCQTVGHDEPSSTVQPACGDASPKGPRIATSFYVLLTSVIVELIILDVATAAISTTFTPNCRSYGAELGRHTCIGSSATQTSIQSQCDDPGEAKGGRNPRYLSSSEITKLQQGHENVKRLVGRAIRLMSEVDDADARVPV